MKVRIATLAVAGYWLQPFQMLLMLARLALVASVTLADGVVMVVGVMAVGAGEESVLA